MNVHLSMAVFSFLSISYSMFETQRLSWIVLFAVNLSREQMKEREKMYAERGQSEVEKMKGK